MHFAFDGIHYIFLIFHGFCLFREPIPTLSVWLSQIKVSVSLNPAGRQITGRVQKWENGNLRCQKRDKTGIYRENRGERKLEALIKHEGLYRGGDNQTIS